MTTACSSTANSIMEVLHGGDALLNLTSQSLNTSSGVLCITRGGNRLQCGPVSASESTAVEWRDSLAAELGALCSPGVTRIVVVSEEHSLVAQQLVSELSRRQIPHLHCTLMEQCEADAFMDAEDTEAVTERLRQLGYL